MSRPPVERALLNRRGDKRHNVLNRATWQPSTTRLPWLSTHRWIEAHRSAGTDIPLDHQDSAVDTELTQAIPVLGDLVDPLAVGPARLHHLGF